MEYLSTGYVDEASFPGDTQEEGAELVSSTATEMPLFAIVLACASMTTTPLSIKTVQTPLLVSTQPHRCWSEVRARALAIQQ